MAVQIVAAAAAVLVAGFASPAAAFATESSWTAARATFYGRDAWPIHTGSCGYGFICPNRWSDQLAQGFDVTAVPDGSDLYGHCGECLSVRCRKADVISEGETLERSMYCRNDKQVKVKIVDTCPCNYPGNAASNKRWCCGDFPHLDMSQWALEKITTNTQEQGVFAIEYRKVACSLDLGSEEAPPILSAQEAVDADPHQGLKPADLDCGALPEEQPLATEAASSQRATVSSGESEEEPNSDTKWGKIWDEIRTYPEEKKQRIYALIWQRIREGSLNEDGHGNGSNRKLLRQL